MRTSPRVNQRTALIPGSRASRDLGRSGPPTLRQRRNRAIHDSRAAAGRVRLRWEFCFWLLVAGVIALLFLNG